MNHSFDDIDTDGLKEERQVQEMEAKIQISWHNVVLKAPIKKNTGGLCGKKVDVGYKKIIDNISGVVLPGQFVSIIGASGAGKTTLLNHLSGRLIANDLIKEGSVKVNGVDISEVK